MKIDQGFIPTRPDRLQIRNALPFSTLPIGKVKFDPENFRDRLIGWTRSLSDRGSATSEEMGVDDRTLKSAAVCPVAGLALLW